MSYAELHCITNFSFLKAASHPEEMITMAAQLGYRALAITDECSVAGVVRAYQAIKDHTLPIQLIIGTELRLNDKLQVVLLATSRQAYAELSKLITLARRRCAKGEYHVTTDDLETIKSCLMLYVPCYEQTRDQQQLEAFTKSFKKRLWISCERDLGYQEMRLTHSKLLFCQQLSEQFSIPVVASGNVRMHHPKRKPLLDLIHAIRLNCPVSQLGAALSSNAEQSLRPLKKLNALFPKAWLAESLVIAQRCQFCLSELRYEYPQELVPKGYTASQHLKHLVNQGFKKRFPSGTHLKVQRIILKELKLIQEQGYEYFFLTVYDIVQFAKRQGILYQGRGSAANSVVCYCLEITAVDPSQIDVLFERFISKERDEPPDIDVDFEHERREEIFQYIYRKYSRERAAIAATVISFKFKSAFRSAGKALGLSESQLSFYLNRVDRRDKSIPWTEQTTEMGLNTESHTGRLLVEMTQALIGFPRHLSQHVGGFVISAGPLHELVPVENAAMVDRTVIQWDKDDLESLGLLKVDILALGMLTAIRKSFSLIETHYERSLHIADITRMGDDPAVYARLQKADTVGVFQIESRAQMSMLPRLKPACYYDLVIQIAIVRPGPIQGDMVHPYLRRREGLEAVEYPSEEMKQVLQRTLGVPIFQEQVIQLAMVAAGFSGGEADQLRRAMASWKKNGQLAVFQDKLVQGMEERGYDTAYAHRIFEQICGFGEYGFPESHSASFAVLAYVSAWLKHYYPSAFYCGLLNSLPMGFYSASQLIQDAQRHQIQILPIDINDSHYDHHLPKNTANALRLGFRLIKGLSHSGIGHLIQKRPPNGYQTLNDLMAIRLAKNDLEALASANALQSLSGNRFKTRWMMMSYQKNDGGLELTDTSKTDTGADDSNQALPSPSDLDNLIEDYASTSLSIDQHPIALLKKYQQLPKHISANALSTIKHQSLVTVIGVVTGRQRPGTASGVTFITLEDETGNINVVVWSATARAQKQPFLVAKILQVDGFLEREGDVIHVIAGRLTDLSDTLSKLNSHSRNFH